MQGPNGCGGGSSAHNKRLLYSASCGGIWRSQHGQFIFKAFLHNCRAQTGVGVDHQHATNDFCIAPRLAESGAHSMDSSFSRHFCIIARPKLGVGVDHHHATNDFCIPPRLAESGAHSMDSSFSRHFCIIAGPNWVWVKAFLHNCKAQTGVGVDHQHTTNDFCIARRLAESGAHNMDSSFSRHCCIIAGLKRVWGWIISTQQTTFV